MLSFFINWFLFGLFSINVRTTEATRLDFSCVNISILQLTPFIVTMSSLECAVQGFVSDKCAANITGEGGCFSPKKSSSFNGGSIRPTASRGSADPRWDSPFLYPQDEPVSPQQIHVSKGSPTSLWKCCLRMLAGSGGKQNTFQ